MLPMDLNEKRTLDTAKRRKENLEDVFFNPRTANLGLR